MDYITVRLLHLYWFVITRAIPVCCRNPQDPNFTSNSAWSTSHLTCCLHTEQANPLRTLPKGTSKATSRWRIISPKRSGMQADKTTGVDNSWMTHGQLSLEQFWRVNSRSCRWLLVLIKGSMARTNLAITGHHQSTGRVPVVIGLRERERERERGSWTWCVCERESLGCLEWGLQKWRERVGLDSNQRNWNIPQPIG